MITLVATPHDFMFVFSYYIVYNVAVFSCFLIICRAMNGNFRTLSELKCIASSGFLSFSFAVVLLSMAGVPPFLGFFVKVLIIKNLLANGLGFFFLVFLAIVFVALFFYVQNLRFVLTPTPANLVDAGNFEEKSTIAQTILIVTINIFLIAGALCLNDLFIVVG
jgi:NADH-quinone oxidoreductase subunit N